MPGVARTLGTLGTWFALGRTRLAEILAHRRRLSPSQSGRAFHQRLALCVSFFCERTDDPAACTITLTPMAFWTRGRRPPPTVDETVLIISDIHLGEDVAAHDAAHLANHIRILNR